MRPKKTVLLVCPNEITASHLTVTMRDIWSYRVVVLTEITDGVRAVSGIGFDLAVLMPTLNKADHARFSEAAKAIKAIQDENSFQTAIFDRQKVLDGGMAEGVNRFASDVMVGLDVLRNGMIQALARKRGPKKRLVDIRQAA